MTPTDKEKVSKIIVDMLMEFQKEQRRIQTEYDNGLSRLSEIEENLINYRETEDVDFKVFSPRKVSTLNEDKLNSMDSEMKEIEEDNKQLQKQLKYYSDKVEKLLVVQAIIDGEVYDISDDKEQIVEEEYSTPINHSEENIVNSIENVNNTNKENINKIDLPDINLFDKQSLVNNLERISHRLDIGARIIDNDVYRTKMELKSIKSGIDDVISSLK